MGAWRVLRCKLAVALVVAVVGLLWASSAAWAALAEVTTGPASNITGHSVTLSGTVNPNGSAVTDCRFEYGFFEDSLGKHVSCASSPGSGNAPVEVTANLTGLISRAYRYRLTVTSADGTVYGQTSIAVLLNAPRVAQEWASAVTGSAATVNAVLEPRGFPTTYRFEYGTTTSYGTSIPIPDGNTGTEGVTVSEPLTGLHEGVTYHYRIVASNEQGMTEGGDAVFSTVPAPGVAPLDTCPNASLRAGLSEGLPDCRAYEMVSPLDKNGSSAGGDGEFTAQSSLNGERASYMAFAGFADTVGSGGLGTSLYLASRGVNGWGTHAVTTPSPPTSYQVPGSSTLTLSFTDDLAHSLLFGYELPGADPGTGAQNLYREDNLSRALETITLTSNPEPNKCGCIGQEKLDQGVVGYSSDMGVIAFQTQADLSPEASGEATKLYEWNHGALHVGGVLPEGTIPAGGSQGKSVSEDGSRILFVATPDGSSAPQLYMRKNGSSTVWVSRSEASSPNTEPEEVSFDAVSRDGTRVLLSSGTPLLDADPGGEGSGLYLYTDGPNPETEPNLTFIGRWQQLQVIGMTDDASHIYFYQKGSLEQSGMMMEEGVYLWDSGSVYFVAKTDLANGEASGLIDARLSADGKRMAFSDRASLRNEQGLAKPAPNQSPGVGPSGGRGWLAMYVYDEPSERVTCASCPSNGEAMTANVRLTGENGNIQSDHAALPFKERYFSSDGRYVFFTSLQSLVPQDTNGLPDVYEYDVDAGQVHLISSGTGEDASWFEDASETGSNVFFLTAQRLTGWDTDTLVDLYDARVNGGFPEPPPAPVGCDGDACQGLPSAVPSFNTASGFTSLGNVAGKTPAVKAKTKVKPRKRARRKRRGRHAKRIVRRVSRRIGR